MTATRQEIETIRTIELNHFRGRMISVLGVPAATKIDFELDNIRFTGALAFPPVMAALVANSVRGPQGLKIKLGPVPRAGAAALYAYKSNTFYFRSWTWGFTPFERQAFIHEAAHAWLDICASTMMTDLTSEAVAYVAGLLFTIYDTTPAGRKPTAPDWVKKAIPPEFGIAYEIAEKIWDQPGATVPGADATRLKKAIQSGDRELMMNPGKLAGYDGV